MKGEWGKKFQQKEWFECKLRPNNLLCKMNQRSTSLLMQDHHPLSHDNHGIIITWVTFEGCLCQDRASSFFKAIISAAGGGTQRWAPVVDVQLQTNSQLSVEVCKQFPSNLHQSAKLLPAISHANKCNGINWQMSIPREIPAS
jgi:hypothetical protein